MTDPRALAAARSNALWCEAVCAAHGRPGEFSAAFWTNVHETPPFYPNLVTLVPDLPAALVHGALLGLAGRGFATGFGVKDSFEAFDLAPLGFRPLVAGRWIWRDASLRPPAPSHAARFTPVCDEVALDAWERGWREAQGEGLASWPGPVFEPSLLRDPDVTFLAAHRDAALVAGVVANRTGDVVGLSNLFVRGKPGRDAVGGCIAAAMAAFPGLPLTGWESGPGLAADPALGFEVVGSLRVWLSRDLAATTS